MNLSQKYQVERITREVVNSNKDKTLNELKRLIKAKIREKISLKVASEIKIEQILEIISQNKILSENLKAENSTKNSINIEEETER